MLLATERNDGGSARTRAEGAPFIHQRPPFRQGVAPAVSSLHFVPDNMSKGSFGDFTRKRRRLTDPITKRRAESMDRGVDLHPSKEHLQSHSGQGTAVSLPGKHIGL